MRRLLIGGLVGLLVGVILVLQFGERVLLLLGVLAVVLFALGGVLWLLSEEE